MRYEDWDVLLFPRGGGVPFKEFRIICGVVLDTELTNINGSFGLPTVTCFVPSLAPGTPFQISIHSWNSPGISQFTRSYTKHHKDVKFEMRLFIDGQLVASTSLRRESNWPLVIANSFDFFKNGDLQPLKFPVFQPELLRQSHWSVADDIGRIKLVISEGFPRDSASTPIERVKNIVAFSFQHAPQDILEGLGIAWPNPSMWRQAPCTTSMSVPSFPSNNAKSHAHSPRRRSSGLQGISPGRTMATTSSVAPSLSNRSAEGYVQPSCIFPLPNTDEIPDCNVLVDKFADSDAYFEWLDNTGLGMDDQHQPTATLSIPSRDETGTLDPSSLTSGLPMPISDDTQFTSFAFAKNEEAYSGHLKAPTNTPNPVDQSCYESGVPFPIFPHNAVLPEDFARSLTASLLNQPPPFQLQPPSTRVLTPEVRSRKENRKRHSTCPIPSSLSTGPTFGLDHQDQRKVSQQMYMPSGGSVPVPNGQTQIQSPKDFAALEPVRRTPSMGKLASGLANISAQSSPREPTSSDSNATVDKGTKRARQLTPGSAKTLGDDEDENRRASPRIRLSPLVTDSPQDGQ
ncbi:hypothetical protein ACJZ2D_009481 [Fusarium nematophilum]